MEKQTNQDAKEQEIDLLELFGKLWIQKKKIVKTMGYATLIGLVVAFSIPKEYTVSVTLSPESGKATRGSLAGMASMLGLGNISMSDADALNMSLFPDIMASTPFALELYHMQVKPEGCDSTMALYAYMEEQRAPWWSYVMGLPGKTIGGVMSLFKEKAEEGEKAIIDPFRLTRDESKRLEAIKKCMEAEADTKTGMTTITVTLQDPVVTATVADSVLHKLQAYITAYRTKKATEDFKYQEMLCNKAQEEYYRFQKEYATYMDKNRLVNSEAAKIEGERINAQMKLANQVYQQAATQMELYRAKIQEDKPVFAVVEPATVPLVPSAPRKVLILIGFMFLAFVGSSAWILFGKELWEDLKNSLKNN